MLSFVGIYCFCARHRQFTTCIEARGGVAFVLLLFILVPTPVVSIIIVIFILIDTDIRNYNFYVIVSTSFLAIG